jgi:hypothetical protein
VGKLCPTGQTQPESDNSCSASRKVGKLTWVIVFKSASDLASSLNKEMMFDFSELDCLLAIKINVL